MSLRLARRPHHRYLRVLLAQCRRPVQAVFPRSALVALALLVHLLRRRCQAYHLAQAVQSLAVQAAQLVHYQVARRVLFRLVLRVLFLRPAVARCPQARRLRSARAASALFHPQVAVAYQAYHRVRPAPFLLARVARSAHLVQARSVARQSALFPPCHRVARRLLAHYRPALAPRCLRLVHHLARLSVHRQAVRYHRVLVAHCPVAQAALLALCRPCHHRAAAVYHR